MTRPANRYARAFFCSRYMPCKFKTVLCTTAVFAILPAQAAIEKTRAILETVAKVKVQDPSGIVVLKDGRIFLGFPRHAVDHNGPTLAELRNGKLRPFPNAQTNTRKGPLEDRLISVHGMTLDANGKVWVIDDGKIAGHPIEDGAIKLMGFDPETGAILAKTILKSPVALADSHMNDLRIDLTHGAQGTAYITDSSFSQNPALVVVDIQSGRSRRVLANSQTTRAESSFVAFLESKPHTYDPKHATFPVGGADGITLSQDNRKLYWTNLTSRRRSALFWCL